MLIGQLRLQDAVSAGSERLSPGKGRAVRPGVLGDAANRDGGASPTCAAPRLGKRKGAEVCSAFITRPVSWMTERHEPSSGSRARQVTESNHIRC